MTTNTTSRVTNSAALRSLIDTAIANGFNDAEVIAKAEKMYEQATAKRKPTGPTKAQRERAAMLPNVVAAMPKGEGVSLTTIAELANLSSWQKARPFMTDAIAAGLVTESTDEKGKKFYTAL